MESPTREEVRALVESAKAARVALDEAMEAHCLAIVEKHAIKGADVSGWGIELKADGGYTIKYSAHDWLKGEPAWSGEWLEEEPGYAASMEGYAAWIGIANRAASGPVSTFDEAMDWYLTGENERRAGDLDAPRWPDGD